jgi:hypothetical protein
MLVMRQGRLQLLDAGVQIFDSLPVEESELIHVAEVKVGVGEDALSHVVELMAMMEVLDGLLEADGDDEAEDDGGDMDEEVSPGIGGVVGGVDVEHGGGFLGRAKRFGGILRCWRDGVWLGHEFGCEECIAHPPPMR